MEIRLTSDEWHSDPEVQRYYSLKKHQEEIENTLSEKSPEYLRKYNELLEKLLGEVDMEKHRPPLPPACDVTTTFKGFLNY